MTSRTAQIVSFNVAVGS